MLWFKRFFEAEKEEVYCLTGESADYEEPECDADVEDAWHLEWSDSELSSVEY
jgi:hypothetical protein